MGMRIISARKTTVTRSAPRSGRAVAFMMDDALLAGEGAPKPETG